MKNHSKNLKMFQKTSRIVWTITWFIFILTSLIDAIRNLFYPFLTLEFVEGVRQLVITVIYTFVCYILFSLIWNRERLIVNVLSEQGVKKVRKLWYAIFSLAVFKFIYTHLIILFVLPYIKDQSKANLFGYNILQGLKPYSDLFIATAILGVLVILLDHTIKLKAEQDLTI
jgi:magnesium-transporting ATPase (P-type)